MGGRIPAVLAVAMFVSAFACTFEILSSLSPRGVRGRHETVTFSYFSQRSLFRQTPGAPDASLAPLHDYFGLPETSLTAPSGASTSVASSTTATAPVPQILRPLPTPLPSVARPQRPPIEKAAGAFF